MARIYDAKRAAVYERRGIPTVATVPWTTDRFLRMLLPDGVATAWRDPSGTVAIMHPLSHQDCPGRPVSELDEPTGSRAAFIVPFGTGLLTRPDTVLQADDVVYAAAVSGTVATVTQAALTAPVERG